MESKNIDFLIEEQAASARRNYTEAELREHKKEFEKQLLELEDILEQDEITGEDIYVIDQTDIIIEKYSGVVPIKRQRGSDKKNGDIEPDSGGSEKAGLAYGTVSYGKSKHLSELLLKSLAENDTQYNSVEITQDYPGTDICAEERVNYNDTVSEDDRKALSEKTNKKDALVLFNSGEDTDSKALKEDTEPKALKEDTEPKALKEDTEPKALRKDTEPKALRKDTEPKVCKREIEPGESDTDLRNEKIDFPFKRRKKIRKRIPRVLLFAGILILVFPIAFIVVLKVAFSIKIEISFGMVCILYGIIIFICANKIEIAVEKERNAELKKRQEEGEEKLRKADLDNQQLRRQIKKNEREKAQLEKNIQQMRGQEISWKLSVDELTEKNELLEQDITVLKQEKEDLQKKLTKMKEIQEQIRILKILINQIGISNKEIEEIMEMTEDLKKRKIMTDDRMDVFIREILRIVKGRKESELYNRKKKYFGETMEKAFTDMCDESKDFLITAEVLYDLMQDYGKNCDFSSVCLLASKAMEIETRLRYFDHYKEYLQGILGTSYRKWPDAMLYCGEPAVFCSMGNIRKIVLKRDPQKGFYIRKSFLDYAKQEMFIEEIAQNAAQEIGTQLDYIEKVRVEFRNPAAHSERFSADEARICLCYIVEEEKVLFAMMKTYKCF